MTVTLRADQSANEIGEEADHHSNNGSPIASADERTPLLSHTPAAPKITRTPLPVASVAVICFSRV